VPHYLIEEVARVDAELHRRFPESSVHTTLGDGPDSIYFVLARTSGGPRSQADPAPVTETSSPFYRWWFAEREDEKWATQEVCRPLSLSRRSAARPSGADAHLFVRRTPSS